MCLRENPLLERTLDNAVNNFKNKKPVMNEKDRFLLVENQRQADKVVYQTDIDKIKAWEKLRFDVLFVGSDHQEEADWKKYEDFFNARNVKIVYIPYTTGVSSTLLRQRIG